MAVFDNLTKNASAKVLTKTFDTTYGDSPTITFSVEGEVIFAGITSVRYYVYSYATNYNHTVPTLAQCTWEGSTISVYLHGGNKVDGSKGVTLTVQYLLK